MDHEALKQHQRRIWSRGDYAAVSDALRPAAVALCDACAVSAGQEVLDVAAGDGNFALACAYEGASVVASDISPGMVERGRARAQAEGYDIEWVEADAEDLPFEDERFECAGSVFGAMIAPRPEVGARELFRVVRPGNTVGMTAWTPESLMADYFAITRSYAPPEPDERPSSTEWGREEVVRERFDGLAATHRGRPAHPDLGGGVGRGADRSLMGSPHRRWTRHARRCRPRASRRWAPRSRSCSGAGAAGATARSRSRRSTH